MKSIYTFVGLVALYANTAAAASFGPCMDPVTDATLAASSCARVKVPLDHAGQVEGELELAIRKFAVEDQASRRGQIWLIAGGPGEPGAAFYPFIDVFRAAFPDYDLLIPDHRGTGESSRLCPEQEALDSEDGYALAGSEWGPCIGYLFANPARTQAFSITNAAQDLAALIKRYREPGEVKLYGVSYGTQLALRLLQVAQPELDALILDGLVPPESAAQWDLSYRTAIVDAVGRQLLDQESTLRLNTLLANESKPWKEVLGRTDLRQFLGALLNYPDLRAHIPAMIDELTRAETTLLQQTATALTKSHEELTPYPQSANSLPLVMLISASENNSRPDLSAEIVAKEAKDALFISPLPGLLTNSAAPLYQRDQYFGQVPEQLPRTLIIHGTLDPNTHYEGALAHAELLKPAGEVQFSTVRHGAHFLAMAAPECFIQVASAFVGDAEVPEHCDAL
ncbi:alpha/beta fold hydrolase [Alkalimonas amylolytica]|uniref:Alpha/beta hydrolase fold n=1 Tax=Alkalimonas amylolytica TaxID=152573 RepID=A0A1H3Z9B3_ALKAM|nr:alpha/beta hydrolase [Alkalimonas amylolytica]SEA19922.1 alpha/beta hydrolase fold [Alkalimonas amylolytica]